MKTDTTSLIKFQKLQRRLGESRRGTVGLLELLWQATIKNCAEGDIGRFENEDIAIMCDWDDDPDRLVDAMVETGWLDRCETHRLVVHDWHEHCPLFVKGNLAKHGKQFAAATCLSKAQEQTAKEPAGPSADATRQVAKQVAKQPVKQVANSTVLPSQAYSSQAKPDQAKRASSPGAREFFGFELPEVLDCEEFRSAWSEWCSHRSEKRSKLTKTSTRKQLTQLAWWGVRRAIAALDYTITKGWTGIREPPDEGPPSGPTKIRLPT